jgi:hypothetical protein
MPQLILVVSPQLELVRILAGLALLAAIGVFVYVFRHLKRIERTIMADNLVPAERGPRNNMVLMICAIPIIVVSLLLFVIFEA